MSGTRIALNIDDPIEDRKDTKGRVRFLLNDDERKIIYQKQTAAKVLELFLEKRIGIIQASEEAGVEYSEVVSYIINGDDDALKRHISERIAAMFLDPEKDHARKEIADAVGMTDKQLRSFTRTPIFQDIYRETFLKVIDDPGPAAVQIKIVEDLLPVAFQTLKAELSDSAPWTVRQGARRDVFKLAGVTQVERQDSDRRDLSEFLLKRGLNIDEINITVNNQYQDAMKRFEIQGEVIDAEPDEELPDDEDVQE